MKSIIMQSNPLFCPPVQLHSHQLKGVYSLDEMTEHLSAYQEFFYPVWVNSNLFPIIFRHSCRNQLQIIPFKPLYLLQ